MSARETILARVRDALGGTSEGASIIAAEAAALVAAPDRLRPEVPTDAVLDRFVAKATSEKVTATVEHVTEAAVLPEAVRRYLDERQLGPRIAAALPRELVQLDWTGLELADDIDRNETVALTFADAGIAETGTLVFPSSPEVPNLFNFLSLHHLAVVRARDVVPHMEDAWRRFTPGTMPRSLSLVTGTSGTADIEGKNIRGAHGPRFLHILILAD
ncbi:MAG: LUD domain-containing protein [Pseudomonadota bacterium]